MRLRHGKHLFLAQQLLLARHEVRWLSKLLTRACKSNGVPSAQGYTGADGSACSACPAGTFKAVNGSSACLPCAAGEYSNWTAATTCHACPQNAHSAQGWSGCKCNAGYEGPDGGNCTACPVGTVKSDFGSGTCVKCAAGNYSNTTAATACVECTVSTFSNTSGSTTCISCPLGFYSKKGSSNCSSCPATTPEPPGCPIVSRQIAVAEQAATAVTAAASVGIGASAACYAVQFMANPAGIASCGGIMLLMEQVSRPHTCVSGHGCAC